MKSRFALLIAAAAAAVALALPAAASAAPSPYYYPYGPQRNVSGADVAAGRWKPCHTSTFAQGWQGLGDIDNACTGDYLMLAAGVASDPGHWALLAAAPRDTVVNYTGDGNNDTVNANGSEWFRGNFSSWGFAPEGIAVDRVWDLCDQNMDQADLHLCWNTWQYTLADFGGRVGTTFSGVGAPDRADFQRVVLEPSYVSVASTPNALTFASQPLSTVSTKQTVTFTVSTDVPGLTEQERALGNLQVTGPDADEFDIVDNDCPTVAPDNASVTCTVKLRFVPQASGARHAAFGFTAFGSTVTLTGTGGQLPQGPAGNDGANGTNGRDGATGPQGPASKDGATGPQGFAGNDGTNGRDGKDGAKGDKGVAVKFAKRGRTRVGCGVTARGAGSRIVCQFNRRASHHWLVQLRDRRGALSSARGHNEKTMVFLSARKPHGNVNAYVIKRLPTS